MNLERVIGPIELHLGKTNKGETTGHYFWLVIDLKISQDDLVQGHLLCNGNQLNLNCISNITLVT